MAKDPAFLFYSDNFQSGTQFFTDEQCGKYIRLLCAQHLHGHLTEKQMMHICKTYDDDIFAKFVKDADGKYYNERLELEVERRKKYSKSRAENRSGKTEKKPIKPESKYTNISKTYVQHMETETGNENESNYDIDYFNRQGFIFQISGAVSKSLDRYLKYRASNKQHGAVKSGEQVEALIQSFKDRGLNDTQVTACINHTISVGAKNIIYDMATAAPIEQQGSRYKKLTD